jgi:hypothetical protein
MGFTFTSDRRKNVLLGKSLQSDYLGDQGRDGRYCANLDIRRKDIEDTGNVKLSLFLIY